MSKKDTHTLGEPLVSIAARFPASMAAQIDTHLAAMRRTIPGITLGRSDALRSLVLHALEALYGPSDGGAPALITDTSTRRLLQKEKRRAREGGVTDTVTDTSVLDLEQQRLILKQDFEALLERARVFMQAERQAESVTDTVTDTHGQPSMPRGKVRKTKGVTDTVTDTETPARPAPNATRRKRLPIAY